jgi:hypothetical protein
MSRKPVPDREAAWVDAQGKPTPAFLEYIKDLDARALREKVATTAPANGQFLVYGTATGTWTLQPTTPPANGEVLIYNSGTGTWVPGTN